MSAEFNDIILSGYAKVKGKLLHKWNKRYLILRQASSKGPKRIEKYHNDKQVSLFGSCKIISFADITGISKVSSSDVNGTVVTLKLRDNTEKHIAFETDGEDWYLRMKAMENGRISITSAIDELLSVYLLPSPLLSFHGECVMQVATDELILFDVCDKKRRLVAWPVAGLRRFGKEDNRLTIESGRRCDTGEGIFSFTSQNIDRVYDKIQKASVAYYNSFKMNRQQNQQDAPRISLSRSLPDTPVASSAVQPHPPVHQSVSFPSSARRPGLCDTIPDVPPPAPPRRPPTSNSSVNNNVLLTDQYIHPVARHNTVSEDYMTPR